MTTVTILGAGAAPGVPSLSCGWGDCNPENPKNIRSRTGIFLDFEGTHILIDTSPELRLQLFSNQIKQLDGVLYTHVHADHLNGIDDLREINRISAQSLNIYGASETMDIIKQRYSYLIAQPDCAYDVMRQPSLIANEIYHNQSFMIKEIKITPIKLVGHNAPTSGYVFNDGEIVHIADFRAIEAEGYQQIKRRPKLLILPLTTLKGQKFHAGLEEVLDVIARLNPERAIINHMASECDFDTVNALTPKNTQPAYDNMRIEL